MEEISCYQDPVPAFVGCTPSPLTFTQTLLLWPFPVFCAINCFISVGLFLLIHTHILKTFPVKNNNK